MHHFYCTIIPVVKVFDRAKSCSEALAVVVRCHDGSFLSLIAEIVIKMRHDIHQRRAYAAHRAVAAVDRAMQIASEGSSADREQAFRWMRLWMAFAASRPVSISAGATAAWYTPRKCG